MGLKARLLRLYWWLEARVAPGLQYAQSDFEKFLFENVREGDFWLDVGCGHTLLPEWRQSAEQQLVARPSAIVGLDPEHAALKMHGSIRLRICGDAGRLPFANEVFDVVTANMVIEHLSEPETQFAEISRVLRPGGRFVFHTPNYRGYPTALARLVPDRLRAVAQRLIEGRPSEDRFPTFYRANDPAAIRRICQKCGLVLEKIELVRSTAMFWMVAPIAFVELLFLRILGSERLASLRPNLIAVLTKPARIAVGGHLPPARSRSATPESTALV